MEQKDAWLDEKLVKTDRRCEKVELLSNRLLDVLDELDVSALASMPGKLEVVRRHTAGPQANVSPQGTRLQRELQAMNEKVSRVLSLAEEGSEARQLLWRIDVNMRRGNGNGSNLAAAALKDSNGAQPALTNNGAENG